MGQDRDRELVYARRCFCAPLVLAAALAGSVALRDGWRWAGVAACIALLAGIAWGVMGLLHRRGIGLGPFLSVAVLVLLLVVPEFGLRALGFRSGSRIQFGYPRPEEFVEFQPDATLFWKLPPMRDDVNSWGFLGPEPQCPPPAGTFRILFLGDSCLQHGFPEDDVPTQVGHHLMLAAFRDPERVECVSLAMPGYSSYQGLKVAELYAAKLRPAVAVIGFGWNDHWLAYGSADAEKRVHPGLMRLQADLRLLQLAGKLFPGRSAAHSRGGVRVPLDQYRRNLEAMWALLDRAGATVVFLTAPSAHTRVGVPEHLVRLGFALDAESVLSLHRQYNQVVRDVARSTGGLLLDVEMDLDRPQALPYYTQDGIHFRPAGRILVARTLAGFLIAHLGAPHGR